MRRVVAAFSICIVVGLAGFSSTAAAGSHPVKHCAGTASATHYGVTLVASRIHVTATTYGRRSAHRVWPAMTCAHVRDVAQAYLTAKLHRPLGQCTVPAIKGDWCHVNHWLCSAVVPNSHSATPEQECVHEVIGRAGQLRRLTYVYFRETDYDHG